MSSNIEEKLQKFLETAKDWSEFKTSIAGVSIVKMPGGKTRPPKLAITINPINPETNKPIKRKALYLTSKKEYELFLDVLENSKTEMLFSTIEEINNLIQQKAAEEKENEEILEL